MRILMLDNEYPPLGGGMGTTNEALLQQFAARSDLTIDLITAALGSRAEQVQVADRIWLHKVPVRNRNLHHSSNRELIWYAVQATVLARRLQRAQPYDFCLAWSTVPAGAVALWLKKTLHLPYLVWVSGPDIPGFERRYQTLYRLLKPLLRAVWRHAQPVIAKCAEEVELIHMTDPTVKVTVIPNGVDLAKFAPGKLKPTDRLLRVICAARLIERKGQQHLIAAVKQLKDEHVPIEVDLVGTGDALIELQHLAQDLDVAEQVQFVGYVSREQIAQRYAAADVFALPSYYEGLSLAALEGLAAGLPLVLSRTGGTRDLVDEGVNGLTFNWGDVRQLAAHLKRLAQDRELVCRMGAASRARAERFAWPAIATTYCSLFNTIAASKDDYEQPKL